jgi:hypothetical protein
MMPDHTFSMMIKNQPSANLFDFQTELIFKKPLAQTWNIFLPKTLKPKTWPPMTIRVEWEMQISDFNGYSKKQWRFID